MEKTLTIATAIPVSGREQMLKLTIPRLVKQGVLTLCIGHTESERNICVDAGAIFYKVPSDWTLGRKCQYGLNLIRGSDIAMFIGSSGMISDNWLDVLVPEFEKGYAMVGVAGTYILDIQPGNNKRMIYYERFGHPLAVGRMISKKALDLIDWTLFRTDVRVGMDRMAMKRLEPLRKGFGKNFILEIPNQDIVKSVRTSTYKWHCLHPIDRTPFKNFPFIDSIIADKIIDDYFPELKNMFNE